MSEMNQTPPVASAPSAPRVTLDDVRAVLEGTALNQTNASKVRVLLGNRGSLETIQKHLNTLRAEVAAAAQPVAADEVPTPSADLVQTLWAHAWASAQAMVQRALAAAQARAEGLAVALGIAQADAQAAQQEADRARDELGAVQSRLDSVDDENQRVIDRVQAAHEEQVLALRAGISEARHEAEHARHELAVAQARHALETATLRGELDRQISVMADLRMALQRPLTPVPEPVLSKQELGAS